LIGVGLGSVASGQPGLGLLYWCRGHLDGTHKLWCPILGELRSQGLKTGLAAAFLYSRAIKIPMLPFMAHYFGASYSAIFVIRVLVFSVLGGAAKEGFEQQRPAGPR
jgi:uncharacterized membrane protein YraQ (UPF0718 family)